MIINEQIYRIELENIVEQLKNHPIIDIYTDGSLTNLKNPNCRMGIGWLTGNNEFPKIQFNAAIERSPSSTKAEATALLHY